MNGLSIEKAKRYDKAIERAKGLIDFSSDSELKTLEYVFPELRESEDEKIRKEILDYIDKATGCKSWVAWLEKQEDKDSQVKLPTFTFDDILALQCCMETVKKVQEDKGLYEKLNDLHGRVYDAYHLEKQGEQKPDDKIEPKFKVGDWCIDNEDGTIFQIVKVLDKTYRYRTNEGKEYSCTHYSLELDARLWTIQDAKDGDVLVNGSNIFIFHFINGTRLMGYCHVNTDDGRFYDDIGKNECFCLIDAVVNPATKEQRDKFEKAMDDAGYTFDFDKNELKEIEDEEYNDEDYGIDGLWHAKNILEKTLGKVDGYQTDDGILDHKCAISAVNKLYKEDAKIKNRWKPSEEQIYWLKWR